MRFFLLCLFLSLFFLLSLFFPWGAWRLVFPSFPFASARFEVVFRVPLSYLSLV